MAEKGSGTLDLEELEIDCFCEIDGVIEQLSKRYTMQLICLIGKSENPRFGQIKRALPDASTSTLSKRLKELEESNLVLRNQYNQIPPRVEYQLTEEGDELCEKLEPLVEWAESLDK
jgi:DNA-binding HxlR family transcriptional regulator